MRRLFGLLLTIPILASCNALAVTDLYAALDEEGRQKKSEFPADAKGVHCVAEVSSGRDDGAILVLIRQTFLGDGTQADRVLGAKESVSSKGSSQAKYSVRLIATDDKGETKDDLPLPAGKFNCEVYLDGSKTADRKTAFLVKPSACPGVQIQQGSPCAGFYEEGRQCPKYGASSKEPASCSCSSIGWNCS